jgi:hypothetical protein
MRHELEKQKIGYEDEIANINRADREEMQQLHEMIAALREKLEAHEKR